MFSKTDCERMSEPVEETSSSQSGGGGSLIQEEEDQELKLELGALGLAAVYDQETLERDIREQLDGAIREREAVRIQSQIKDVHRQLATHEKELRKNEDSCGEVHRTRLETLGEELRALEDRLSRLPQERQHQVVPSETGGGESEAERRVRLGEMTPFGSVLGEHEGLSRVCEGLSALEKYLKEQSQLEEGRRKTRGPKATNKSAGGKRNKSPLKKSILFPRKRRKKDKLGTFASDDYWDKAKSPGKLPSEETPLEQEDSGSEYVPSSSAGEESSGDLPTCQSPARRKGKSKRKSTSLPEDWASDDSDWECSDQEARARKRRRSKKEVDDGDPEDYEARLGLWEKTRSPEEEALDSDHELEGGFRIPKRRLWDKLYKYQRVGVQWLWELHQQRCGGILGDEMGLGKTLQVIAFLAGLQHSQLTDSRHHKYRGLGPTLIVCPTTVMHQWVKEFHTWWPSFRVAVLHESGSFTGSREVLVRNINSACGVLVTSYVGVVRHKEALLSRDWHYLVLDEGHKIRNPDAQVTLCVKMFRTAHRLILSGSPMQNSLKELWSLFDFVFPGKLGTLPVFLAQLAVPITQGGYANASQVQVATAYRCATVLKDSISPYLLRRTKQDLRTTQARLRLPDKSEQVLFCGLTEEQRSLYRAYVDSGEVGRILQGHAKVFLGLITLRKICNHPDLYSGGPKLLTGENEEDLPEDRRYGHWNKSGKMIVVESLLKIWKKQGHRVLLFTQSRQMLCILEAFVQKREYRYLKLDGGTSVAARQPLIEKFNQDASYFVFLLTTRVGGLGVNLTGADRVVIYDPDWNPATDTQARERAWRIGQRNPVTIYRLVTAGTVEEKIYHRQIFKQFLSNKVLQDPRQRRFFKSNDLFELFTLNEGDRDGSTETSAIFAGTGSEVRADHLRSKRREMRRKRKEMPEVNFSESKVERMKQLAHKLSLKIGASLLPPPQPENSSPAPSEPTSIKLKTKCKSKRRELAKSQRHVKFEGETVPFLVGRGEAGTRPEEEGEKVNSAHDDYVLRKLFKKSGLQTALKHDAIMEGGPADYVLVEGEALRVAQDAVAKLRESRRLSCHPAIRGVPTWTGTHGGTRLQFGKKKKTTVTPGKKASEAGTSSSELLLSRIRARNQGTGVVTQSQPDNVELLAEVREFVSHGAECAGRASTREIVRRFKDRLPQGSSPLFKCLLQEICHFHRMPSGGGVWKLKGDFSW